MRGAPSHLFLGVVNRAEENREHGQLIDGWPSASSVYLHFPFLYCADLQNRALGRLTNTGPFTEDKKEPNMPRRRIAERFVDWRTPRNKQVDAPGTVGCHPAASHVIDDTPNCLQRRTSFVSCSTTNPTARTVLTDALRRPWLSPGMCFRYKKIFLLADACDQQDVRWTGSKYLCPNKRTLTFS